MINQDLLTYIENEIVRGTPKNIIQSNLLSNSWNEKDVAEAFSTITIKNYNSPPQPQAQPQVQSQTQRQPQTESPFIYKPDVLKNMNEELKTKIESARKEETYWNDEAMINNLIQQGYKKEDIDEVLTTLTTDALPKSLEKKTGWKMALSIFWKTAVVFILILILFFFLNSKRLLLPYSFTLIILFFIAINLFSTWIIARSVSRNYFLEYNDTQYNNNKIIKSAVFYFFFLSFLPGLIPSIFFSFIGVISMMALSGSNNYSAGFLILGISVIGWIIQWVLPSSIIESLIVFITLKKRLSHLKNPKSLKYKIMVFAITLFIVIAGASVAYMNKDVLLNTSLAKSFFNLIGMPYTISDLTQTKSVKSILQFGSAGSGEGQFNHPRGIAVDSSGNIYVADSGNNRVQKFNSSGQYILQFSQSVGNGLFSQPDGIAFDASGNIYVTVTDVNSVNTENSHIQKFSPSGTFLSQFGTGGDNNGQLSYPYAAALDSSNNIYVTDIKNNCVDKFDSSGNFISQIGSTGSSDGQFDGPGGISIDASGNIYVTDSGNGRVEKFDSSGNYLSQFGSNGMNNGQLSYPSGIVIDSLGNIYVADTGNGRVQKFNSSGVYISHFGQFGWADGMAIDSQNNVYVVDYQGNNIQKFSQSNIPSNDVQNQTTQISTTTRSKTVDESNDVQSSSNTGPKSLSFVSHFGTHGKGDGQFDSIYSIAIDSIGNIYVGDGGNYSVQKFDPSGKFLYQLVHNNYSFGQFNSPEGIAIDSADNVFVAESMHNRIQKFSSSGKFLSEFGSYGTADGQFASPENIAIDSDNNIYVADTHNYRVQKFNSSGKYISQFSDGVNYPKELDTGFTPGGMAFDSAGNIYVSSYVTSSLDKFDSSGHLISMIGSHGSGDGQFSGPEGIAIDSTGNIYVTDSSNSRVQVFDPSDKYLNQFSYGLEYPRGIAIDLQDNVYVSSGNYVEKFSQTK